MRCSELDRKCDINLESMGDYQILEFSKNISSMDSEMREIFDRVTSLSKIAAFFGEGATNVLEAPISQQNKTLATKNSFAATLNAIITECDIRRKIK